MKRFGLISAVLLFGLGCGVSAPTPIPSAAPATEAPAVQLTQPPAEGPTEDPTHTPAPPPPTAAPPSGPDPVCVPPQGFPPLEAESYQLYPQAIADFLNAGGPVSLLSVALRENGFSNTPNPAIEAELNGDGKQDVVVSVTDPNYFGDPAAGALLIYTCEDGQFILRHVELSAEHAGAPALLLVQDLNADGLTEIVFSSPTCGAHSCFEDAAIWSWDGAGFVNRLGMPTNDLPFPNMQVTDYDQDGIYNLEVSSQGFGSVGAGPQRPLVRTYEYDPAVQRWVAVSEGSGAAVYRIHVLHDADDAMRRGDYTIASVYYEMVIQDDALKDWVDPRSERLTLGAYAHYKMAISLALQGDQEGAEAFLADLVDFYDAFSPQFAYIEMAQLFLDAYPEEGLQGACSVVRIYAEDREDTVLAPLGPQAFGYANRDYTAEDICP